MKRLASTDMSKPAFATLEALPALSALLRQAQLNSQLGHRLEMVIPSELRPHVRFAKVSDGCLFFLADTSTWAAKLRLLSFSVLADAKKLGLHELTAVKVRVKRST
jgi:hypothetical protein